MKKLYIRVGFSERIQKVQRTIIIAVNKRVILIALYKTIKNNPSTISDTTIDI
jgi:hypothetical protein